MGAADRKETRAKLEVDAGRLQSLVNGKSHVVGKCEPVLFQTLRERVSEAVRERGGEAIRDALFQAMMGQGQGGGFQRSSV